MSLACRLDRFENCAELHVAARCALDKTQASAERIQHRHRPVGRRTVVPRVGSARPILDPSAQRCALSQRLRRRGGGGRRRSGGLGGGRGRLPDARGVRLLRAASLTQFWGIAGLAQIDAEPAPVGGVIIIAVMTTLMAMMGVMIGVICKLTLIQERRNLFMGVPIRDCRKLEIEDVWMPQPILHHIFVYLFFCADKPCNLRNGNVPHMEDAGGISVYGKTYNRCVLCCVKSVSLNLLAIF